MKKLLVLLSPIVLACALNVACGEPAEPILPQPTEQAAYADGVTRAGGGLTRAPAPVITGGSDYPTVGTQYTYSLVPGSGITFVGWEITPNRNYSVSGSMTDPNSLKVVFHTPSQFKIIGKCKDGSMALNSERTINATAPTSAPASPRSIEVSPTPRAGYYVTFTADATFDAYTTFEWTSMTGLVSGSGSVGPGANQYGAMVNDYDHNIMIQCRAKRFGVYSTGYASATFYIAGSRKK